jgi:hypothetical protein
MNYTRLTGCAVLLMFLAFPAAASMVSFVVVETGLNEEVPSPQYSSLWEDGLMAVFFDAGHIVTNSPITRIDKKPSFALSNGLDGTLKDDFDEAVFGGADYFVLGFLEYNVQTNAIVPNGITIRLYELDSGKLIFEETFPAGTGKNLNDEYQLAKNTGQTIVSHIKEW